MDCLRNRLYLHISEKCVKSWHECRHRIESSAHQSASGVQLWRMIERRPLSQSAHRQRVFSSRDDVLTFYSLRMTDCVRKTSENNNRRDYARCMTSHGEWRRTSDNMTRCRRWDDALCCHGVTFEARYALISVRLDKWLLSTCFHWLLQDENKQINRQLQWQTAAIYYEIVRCTLLHYASSCIIFKTRQLQRQTKWQIYPSFTSLRFV